MSIPFRDGTFSAQDDGVTLLTSKCTACGRSFFPRRADCLACGASTQDTEAGPEGSLFSFSTVHMPTPHFKPPYSVGLIELADGLRVFSQISKAENEKFTIGMPLRAQPRVLWTDEQGDVDGFEFVPA